MPRSVRPRLPEPALRPAPRTARRTCSCPVAAHPTPPGTARTPTTRPADPSRPMSSADAVARPAVRNRRRGRTRSPRQDRPSHFPWGRHAGSSDWVFVSELAAQLIGVVGGGAMLPKIIERDCHDVHQLDGCILGHAQLQGTHSVAELYLDTFQAHRVRDGAVTGDGYPGIDRNTLKMMHVRLLICLSRCRQQLGPSLGQVVD